MNYLEQGAATLLSRMKDYAGVKITYRRGGHGITFTAVPARVVTDQATTEGVLYRDVARDFIIKRSDISSFDPPTPDRGDEIVQTIDGESWVFVVTVDANFTSHYEEADSYGVAWRVHTRRDKHRA